MKILQLIQKPQLRGAEIFASQLSGKLSALNHEVVIACLQEGRSALAFEGDVVHLNRPSSKRLWDWEGWKKLAALVKEIDPDIVQSNAGDTLKYAVFSKLFFRWRQPIVFRNANKVSDFIDSIPKKIFNRWLVGQVQHVISVSELCRLDFIKTYSYNPDETTTAPIGLELSELNREMPHDLYNFFEKGSVLVNVSSFVPEKNHMGLIHMMEQWPDDVKLILVGDGKLKADIDREIEVRKLTKRILTIGYRMDVLSIVSNAKALVLPSRIEGLPGVILEAMYCKTPVVAYDVGGISEVVKNNETGWLVKANDENGFVQAVNTVLFGGHEKIIEHAYQMVIKEFDNREIAKRFLKVYEQVVDSD